MSQTISAVAVILLAQILPRFGVQLDDTALTTTISTVLTIASAVWIYIRRRKQGDVNLLGARK